MTIIPSASLRGPWAKAPHSHPDCLTTSQYHSTLRLDNHSSTSSMAYYSYLHHLGLETPHSTFFLFFLLASPALQHASTSLDDSIIFWSTGFGGLRLDFNLPGRPSNPGQALPHLLFFFLVYHHILYHDFFYMYYSAGYWRTLHMGDGMETGIRWTIAMYDTHKSNQTKSNISNQTSSNHQ